MSRFKYIVSLLCLLMFQKISSEENKMMISQGRMQYEIAKMDSKMPRSGSCWKDALAQLDHGCKNLDDEMHSRLALNFTNCFLKKAGMQTYPCEEGAPIADCLKDVDCKAWNSYLNFFTHTQNMCYFLESQAKKTYHLLMDLPFHLKCVPLGLATILDVLLVSAFEIYWRCKDPSIPGLDSTVLGFKARTWASISRGTSMSMSGAFALYLQTVDDLPTPFSLSGIIITMLFRTGCKGVGHFILRKASCMSQNWEFLGTGFVVTVDLGMGLAVYCCFASNLNDIIMSANSEGLTTAIGLHFLVEKADSFVHYMLISILMKNNYPDW